MAKLFIGIALLVMLATAALSFLAKGNIDKLQSSLKETKGQIAAAQGKAASAKSEIDAAKKETAEAVAKAEEASKASDAGKADLEKAKSDAAAAANSVGDLNKQIDDLKQKLADASKVEKPIQGENPEVGVLTTQLKDTQNQLAEQKQVAESSQNRAKVAEQKLAEAESKERQFHVGATRAGLQGRVLAINPGWNFVVLSVGDKQGVMINSPLLVVRGNEPIARLRITSVEPSTSIADLIPGSVRKGISVQPGDTVVFEGRSPVTAPPKPAAADTSAAPLLPN